MDHTLHGHPVRAEILRQRCARARGTPVTHRLCRCWRRLNSSPPARTWRTPTTSRKVRDFSVLDLLPDSHLTSVVKDSCIVFSPSEGCPGEALSIIRAKEQVHATLAATARRLRLEGEARKTAGVSASREAGEPRRADSGPREGANTSEG
jgi:hypothetical protein